MNAIVVHLDKPERIQIGSFIVTRLDGDIDFFLLSNKLLLSYLISLDDGGLWSDSSYGVVENGTIPSSALCGFDDWTVIPKNLFSEVWRCRDIFNDVFNNGSYDGGK